MAEPQTTLNFSFFDQMSAGTPYQIFALMRKGAPVVKLNDGFWAVAKYDDVVHILRDPETFSSIVGARQMAGEEMPSMIFNDPPMHTRLRGLISQAFTPRVVELQRANIQTYCDELVARLTTSAEGDVITGLAYPLPVMVIANMLGVADGDLATFKRWSDEIIENLGSALLQGDDSVMEETNKEFDAYFSVRLDKLRREPEDNLISELVHVETEEGRLTQDELLMFCRLLLVAGNETTTGLIFSMVRVFSEFPEVLTRLRAEPQLVPSAIEEALRFYAPFPATIRRSTREVELRGVTVAANERIIVLLGSANRDEEVFDNADEFVIDREPNRHVGFGMGIHYCVGAPLARLEANIAMNALIQRITRVEILNPDPASYSRVGGPKSLPVRFELALPAAV